MFETLEERCGGERGVMSVELAKEGEVCLTS